MSNDKLMVNAAIVIEKCNNGVIVRPHQGWYAGDPHRTFSMDEVKVFTDRKDFEKWFASYFPKGAA